MSGSPPHVRGKENVTGPELGRTRITPAYAGKSKSTFIGQSPAEDHPRVCGEKSKTKDTAAYTPGSPPHVRGKATRRCILQQLRGITPACAGKSRSLHARSSASLGSPPRMRGKGLFVRACDFCFRITPAYAGKSVSHCAYCICDWDHPRVCGEKLVSSVIDFPSVGITPAYAGKRYAGHQ